MEIKKVKVMNKRDKEFIEGQLKLSRKQDKYSRSDYLCSQFNGIEYAIKLEKYTNKLQQENKQLKKQIEILENERDIYKRLAESEAKEKNKYNCELKRFNDILNELKAFCYFNEYKNVGRFIEKLEKGDKNE